MFNFKLLENILIDEVAGMLRLQGRYGKALADFKDGLLRELGDEIQSIVFTALWLGKKLGRIAISMCWL